MTTELTFLFADLAGYTAMTEVHGDEDAARIATQFHELAGGWERNACPTGFNRIDRGYIERLLANPEPEGTELDYNENIQLENARARIDLFEDVCAVANARGCDLAI